LQPPGLLAVAWMIARKDLAIEYRTRSAFFSSLVFSLLGVSIFYMVWDPTAVRPIDMAPGVLWTIFAFAGMLGLHRTFGLELQTRAMDGLLLAPVPREAIFLGKALAAIGLVTVGTLFSSMTVHTRFAELLLPMLALPFFIPVVVPAAQASAKLLVGADLETVMPWIQVLVAFDLMFGVACVLAFPFTIED
jgi:heme exporter protein B